MKVTRKSARALQALVIFVAIALVATAIPAVVYSNLPVAEAAAATVYNESDLRTRLADADTTEITLGGNITVDVTNAGSFAYGLSKNENPIFTVPAGKSVTLNMNGHSITWSFEQDNQVDLLASNTHSQGNYVMDGNQEGGFHWILLDNRGTLNITGSGSLSTTMFTDNVTAQGSSYNNRAGALCTIRNSGDLTISNNVSVNTRFGYSIEENNNKGTTVYMTGIGIYQTGGSLVYGGSINTYVWSQAAYTGYIFGKQSAGSFATAYGIYAAAGTVDYVAGSGNRIDVFSYAGFNGASGEPTNNCLQALSVGIYTTSSESSIIGATIDCRTTYDDDDDGDSGGNGVLEDNTSIANAVGVMYSGNVTPTIGSGTNITTSCGVYNDNGWSGAYPPEYERPVSQASQPPLNLFDPQGIGSEAWHTWHANTSGDPTSETSYQDEAGNIWTPSLTDTSLNGGIPSSQTSAYHKVLVAYRFYNTEHQLESYVIANGDSDMANAITLQNVSNGRVNLSSYSTFTYAGGGAPKNEYFYNLSAITYNQVTNSGVATDWYTTTGGGMTIARNIDGEIQTVNPTVNVSAGQTTLIFVDYEAIPTDTLRVNLNNASALDMPVTEVEVEYTGTNLAFGSDILVHVYKCNSADDDPTAMYPYSNDIEVTDRFANIGSGSTSASFEVYNTSGQLVQTNTLPSQPGTYTVKLILGGETTYNSNPASAMNFGAATFDFTLIIRPRNVTITQTGVPELTYGQRLSALRSTDLAQYFEIDTGVPGLTASGTFEWVTPDVMPEVGERTYQLRWTNSQGLFETVVIDSVRVKVNGAPLTVTAKPKTVVYGEELTLTADDFIFSGLADVPGEAEAVFELIKNSVLVDGATYVPGQFNAGTHSYALSTSAAGSYTITNKAGELTISRASLTLTAPAVTKEYDGTNTVDIPFDASCVIAGLYDVYGADGVFVNTYTGATLANGGAVGSTTASVQISRFTLGGVKANNYTVGAVTNATSIPVNVTKANPLVDALVLENASITYDPTKTLSQFETLTPDTENGVIKVVAAGDRLADGRAATPGKWVWKNDIKPTVNQSEYVAQFVPDDSNYGNVEQTVTVRVSPLTITVGVTMTDVFYGDDQPAGSYVFSGFPADSPERINFSGGQLNAVGFSLSGNVYYACAYDPTSTDNKDAGTYPITLTSTLTADNYRFVADTSCTLTVKPKDLIITPATKNITYGTSLQQSDFSLTITGFVSGDETLQAELNPVYAYDVSATTPVGEYPLTVSFANELPNYNFVINEGKIVVSKAVVTVQADDIEVRYGGTPDYTYTYNGFKGSDGAHVADIVTGAPILSSNYSISSAAGETFAIAVNVNNMSARNYAFVASDRIAMLTVLPGSVYITAKPTYTVENGRTLADAVIATEGTAVDTNGTTVEGTFRIDNRDAVLEYKNNGNIGNTVAVTFYPANPNYGTVSTTADVEVLPRAISGQPAITGTLMSGETITLDISTLDPSNRDYYDPTSIVWSVGGVQKATGSWTLVLDDSDIGKTVTVSVSPYSDSGFSGTATYTTTIRVSEGLSVPGLDELLIQQDTIEVTYDKQAHRFVVNKEDQSIGDVTVRYNGSTTAPTAAGTYVVTVDIGSSALWAPVSGLRVGTLTINPRPITVVFTAADKTYDGKTNATISDFDASQGIISGDNVSVNRSVASFDFVDANAGDGIEVVMRYAYLEGTARDNYVISQDAVYANIYPKEITAVAYATAQDYEENNYTVHEITFGNPTGVLAADRNNVTLNPTTGTMGNNAAGSQDVTYIEYNGVLTGSKAGNYVFTASNESTLKVTIRQITDPNLEYPKQIEISYNSLLRLDDLSGELPYGWSWNDPTIVPTVRVKMYDATYTPSNPSYKTETYQVVINVLPVDVTVIPDSHSIEYGSAVPNLTYTVEGFTGDDDVTDCSGMIIIQTNYQQGNDVTGAVPYRVWVSSSTISNPNYNFNLRTEGQIEVTRRAYTVTPSAEDVVYDPNNYDVPVTFTGSGAYVDPNAGEDDVYLSYTETIGTLSNNDAGSRTVTYTLPTLQGAKAGNYELRVSGAAVRINVLKADPIVVWPTSAEVVYGQRFDTAVFEGGSGEGTFMFVDSSRVASSLDSAYYEVRFTPTNSNNYNSLTNTVLLRVTHADLNMSVSISGTLYEGQTLTAAISGVPQDALQYLHYAWYRVAENGTAVLVSDASTYELGASDIGYYIRLEVSADPTAPYSGEASFTTVRTIEEEQLTFWQRLMKWWYAILAAIQSLFDITISIG